MALSADDIAKMNKFLDGAQKLTKDELAAEYGVRAQFISELFYGLRKIGVTVENKRKQRKRRIDVDILRKLKAGGVNDAEIARHFNVTRQSVSLASKELGLRKKRSSVADVLGDSAPI